MARIQYSALVDNIRGSIGGTTFQKNAYGYTIKKKPNIIKPKSNTQQRSKSLMSIVTRSWRDLSSGERAAYNTFASTYPQYSKFNPTSQLSGYGVFVKYNLLRLLVGAPVLSSFSGAPPSVDTLSYIVDLTANVLKIFLTSTTDDELWYILFFASRPFTVAQNFIGTKTRYMNNTSNLDGSLTITDDYTGVFGNLPSVGDRIALDALLIAQNVPYVLARDSQVYTIVTGT